MDKPAVYLGHLETHHVALVGEEATQFFKSSMCIKSQFYAENGTPDNTRVKEQVLVAALRAQEQEHYYLASENINSVHKPVEGGSFNPVLSFYQSGSADSWSLPAWGAEGPASAEDTLLWQLNLSQLSYDQAFLGDEGKTEIELMLGGVKIPLFNVPYLLSVATLSHSQRSNLFSHLSVKLLLTLKQDTCTVLLDLWGDDGKNVHYRFAGSLPGCERIMFSHWYEDIMPDVCINEPPEVRGQHA